VKPIWHRLIMALLLIAVLAILWHLLGAQY